MFLKNFWLKFFNRNEFKSQKFLEARKTAQIEFKSKFEKEIDLIHRKISNQKKLNFLHSGHAADTVNLLPVIKELSLTHECNLYININKPLNFYYKHPAKGVFMNEKIFSMLKPLLDNQSFLNNVEIYNNQAIDVNFDMYRDMPINQLFDNITYASIATGIQPNYDLPFLKVEEHSHLKDKIIIHRTFRYRNDYQNIYFIGIEEEFLDLKREIKNLNLYDCKNFLDMASIIKSSKVVIANSSIGWAIAEGLDKPRLLESCPYFPACQPHGLNAFNFYFQPHFENLFEKLIKTKTK